MGRRQTRLLCKQLENKIAPTVFNVTNLAETGLGSIRQAVIDANNSSGADVIQIPSTLKGVVTLTSGPMVISDPVTINGPVTLFSVTFQLTTNNSGRAFIINADTTINGISTSSTTASGSFSGLGGAIYSTAALTVTDCSFGAASATNGGAIYQTGPSLIVTRCGFYSGGAVLGGGIYANGTVSLQYCEFDSVVASNVSGSAGGGVYLASGSLNISSCSFAGCGHISLTFCKGGAVYVNGTFSAQNSTFANNYSSQGGGLYLTTGGTLWNCTVAGNTTGSGKGGGIYGNVTLESTIVSNNGAGTGPDIFGAVTAKNCALGTSSGFSSFTDNGNNLAFGLNLQLENGSNGHGGLVPLCSIQATSPCKNMGSNPAGLTFDPRGPSYNRIVGGAPDIGAFEVQPPPTVIVHVNEGAPQRSQVTQSSYTLPYDITLGSFPVWQLKRVSDNAMVTLTPAPGTVALTTVTYRSSFTGGPLNGNSLADGVYQLTIPASKITDGAGQHLDGNGDGVGGDDYVSPTTPGDPNRIFRLFGDANGDATVDAADFIQFRLSLGGSAMMFDFDNDGSVSTSDFIQFRLRFGGSV